MYYRTVLPLSVKQNQQLSTAKTTEKEIDYFDYR